MTTTAPPPHDEPGSYAISALLTNAVQMNDDQRGTDEYRALVASIKKNGLLEQIHVTEDLVVGDGNTRLWALRELKRERIVAKDVKVHYGLFGRDGAVTIAVEINKRRHMTGEQRAAFYWRLRAEGWSVRRIAREHGKSPSAVSELMSAHPDPTVKLPATVVDARGREQSVASKVVTPVEAVKRAKRLKPPTLPWDLYNGEATTMVQRLTRRLPTEWLPNRKVLTDGEWEAAKVGLMDLAVVVDGVLVDMGVDLDVPAPARDADEPDDAELLADESAVRPVGKPAMDEEEHLAEVARRRQQVASEGRSFGHGVDRSSPTAGRCPQCGAEDGQPCTTSTGGLAKAAHKVRVNTNVSGHEMWIGFAGHRGHDRAGRQLTEALPCLECMADVDEPCITSDGNVMASYHWTRCLTPLGALIDTPADEDEPDDAELLGGAPDDEDIGEADDAELSDAKPNAGARNLAREATVMAEVERRCEQIAAQGLVLGHGVKRDCATAGPCSQCGAKDGEPCKTASGRPVTEPHKARTDSNKSGHQAWVTGRYRGQWRWRGGTNSLHLTEALPCTECAADVGEPCLTAEGNLMESYHWSRCLPNPT
jgi:hypothetical protein